MFYVQAVDTDDAKCRRCEAPIPRGTMAFRSWFYAEPGVEVVETLHYDFHCAIDVHPTAALGALERCSERWDEYDAICARAQKRADGVILLEAALERARLGEPLEYPVVEQVTDRLGRLRVHVRFGGSLSSGNGPSTALNILTRDWTIYSSKREYVLVAGAPSSQTYRPEDPSQPVVAAVFGAVMKVKIVGAQKEKLAQWKSAGLRTPILWLVGPESKDQAVLDTKVLELRGHLNAAGFNGDEALVLSHEKLDTAALTQLARTLDELLDSQGESKRDADSWANALALLEESLENELVESYATHLTRLLRTYEFNKSLSPEERSAAAALVARADVSEATSTIALQLFDKLDSSTQAGAVRKLLENLLQSTPRALAPESKQCIELLSRWRDPLLWPILVSAIYREKSLTGRASALVTYLRTCTDKTAQAVIIEELTKGAAGLKGKDVRRSLATDMAEAFAAPLGGPSTTTSSDSPTR